MSQNKKRKLTSAEDVTDVEKLLYDVAAGDVESADVSESETEIVYKFIHLREDLMLKLVSLQLTRRIAREVVIGLNNSVSFIVPK